MLKRIQQDDGHRLLVKDGMLNKEFPSDYRQIRYFTLMIAQKAPPGIKEINLLEQQISELIKNAVKHGNKSHPKKKIKVWYSFTPLSARIIVEDEGKGFKKINDWNSFNAQRYKCLLDEDFVRLADYISYRTNESDDNDGGNALFAATEYWNEGVVFNKKGNTVGVSKRFPKRLPGIEIA